MRGPISAVAITRRRPASDNACSHSRDGALHGRGSQPAETMQLEILTSLDYWFAQPTDVLLQVEIAFQPDQTVAGPYIALSHTAHFARVSGHSGIGERIWLRLEGRFTADYTANVTITRPDVDLSGLGAVAPHLLPGDTVEYLLASRYCPSDLFQNLVEDEFGQTQGGARIQAIRDWIHARIAYRPGTSTSTTDALETLVSRQGVCRDFAHLMVSMARASEIPARFVSVYAPDVDPPDFHAVAEVYLDGAWHLVDATGMADAASMARIGVGRDAADTSFLTSFGPAVLNSQTVTVRRA